MHLLYLDESGQHGGNYFVLAGVSVFERQTYWLSKDFDEIQREVLPDEIGPVEFHASVIRAGKAAPWSQLSKEMRHQVLDMGYAAIAQSKAVLFGVAVDRRWLAPDQDSYLYSFECLLKKFDDYLRRLYDQRNEQRGLVVIAESQFRERIQSLALQLRREGTRWVSYTILLRFRSSLLPSTPDYCRSLISVQTLFWRATRTVTHDTLMPSAINSTARTASSTVSVTTATSSRHACVQHACLDDSVCETRTVASYYPGCIASTSWRAFLRPCSR